MKRKIKNNSKKVNILTFSIVLLICIISIGFSSFSDNLNINNLSAEIRIQKDIRVTGVSLLSNSDNVISKEEDYNVKNIYSNLTLPNQNSTVTYRVEITNIGNVEMGIFDITSNISNLEVKPIGEYNLKDKICVDDKCALGIKKYIDIEVSYKDNEFNQDNINFNMLLTFDFRPFYDVLYEGFDEDTSSYPQEIIDGDNLKIEFNDFSGKLEVYMDNALLTTDNYTFTNNVLEVKNVTGNVTIKRSAQAQTNSLYAFMQEKSQGDDKDFDFQSDNIQNGVFMHYESRNDDYPVYYYRGDVENSVVYANHCWRIVRTTETGGLKLVYDGELKNSGTTCTDTHNYLGSEAFNYKINDFASPSQVGYMYGMTAEIHKIIESRYDDIVSKPENMADTLVANASNLVVGKNANWDGSSYTLNETKTNTATEAKYIFDEATNNGYYYTCLNSETTCSEVYYLYKRRSSSGVYEVYTVKLTKGLTAEQALDGKTVKKGTIFGNDVSWDNSTNQYKLVTTKEITDLDELEDDIRGGDTYGPLGYHYTCLNSTGVCESVYYVYYNDYGNYHDTTADGLFGISLYNGLNVTDTLDLLLTKSTNEHDSHAKEHIDKWYQGTGGDFKGNPETDALIKYENDLDDVLWCNNRAVAGYHGWDLNADNHDSHNKYLHFDAFKRLVGEQGLPPTRPSLLCDSVDDSFTVSNPKGNKDLTYPIAMLTADEAVLAGAVNQKLTNTYITIRNGGQQSFMTPYYLSDDHTRVFVLKYDTEHNIGLDSGYAASSYAVRPAIALKPIFKIKDGTGTPEDPYTLEKVSQ